MNIMEIKESRYYRVDEIAEIFGVSARSIRNWANDPDIGLPAYRLGSKQRGTIRILGADVITWLNNCKLRPWE